jgi:hypothetical protein
MISMPCNLARPPRSPTSEPKGYSFSQKGTKSRPAARTRGATSASEIKNTSCLRDWSFRASVVIGLRWPVRGRQTKPIFILAYDEAFSVKVSIDRYPRRDARTIGRRKYKIHQNCRYFLSRVAVKDFRRERFMVISSPVHEQVEEWLGCCDMKTKFSAPG